MTPTTYGRDFAYCLKSHGGVRGFNASLWRFLLRCTLFCHSVATFLTSVSSYEGGCGFEASIFSEATLENSKNGKRTFIGLFDPSVRRYIHENILSFTIPMSRFREMYYTIQDSCLSNTPAWGKIRERICRE